MANESDFAATEIRQATIASALIYKYPKVLVFGGVMVSIGTIIPHAGTDLPSHLWGYPLVEILFYIPASILAGAMLSYQSWRFQSTRPVRLTLALSWRISMLWAVVFAIAEWTQSGHEDLSVERILPLVVVQFVNIAIGFAIGLSTSHVTRALKAASTEESLQTIASTGGIVGALAALYSAIGKSSDD